MKDFTTVVSAIAETDEDMFGFTAIFYGSLSSLFDVVFGAPLYAFDCHHNFVATAEMECIT